MRSRHRSRSRRRWLWAIVFTLAAYPATVLGYVYWHSLLSELPGGRHGPQDAYRHALASAVVAYSLSPAVVDAITRVMEFGDDASSLMDRHNNAIGRRIGSEAGHFAELRPRVLAAVRIGRVNARDPEQIAWMPPSTWSWWPL